MDEKIGVIPHEFGHVIAAYWQDKKYYPKRMILSPDRGQLAEVVFGEHNEPLNLTGIYSRFNDICCLGGIFGEYICKDRWYPWYSRSDIDIFVCENQNSKSKLVYELDEWLWVKNGSGSFYKISSKYTFTGRRHVYYTLKDLYNYLPNLANALNHFKKRIDCNKFIEICDDIASSGKLEFGKRELDSFAKKVML